MDAVSQSVTDIKGVGNVKRSALAKLEIKTIQELLYHFPREYEDRRSITPISDLKPFAMAQIKATVVSSGSENPVIQKGRNQLKILVRDGSGAIDIVFYNAAHFYSVFLPEQEYIFYGKVYPGKAETVQMVHPDFKKSNENTGFDYRILPVYPLTAGITQKDLRKWINICFDTALGQSQAPVSASTKTLSYDSYSAGAKSSSHDLYSASSKTLPHDSDSAGAKSSSHDLYSASSKTLPKDSDSAGAKSPSHDPVTASAETLSHDSDSTGVKSSSHGPVTTGSKTPNPIFLPEEFLPEKTIASNNLCGIEYALRNIHFPEDRRRLQEARYRLIFEELLVLQTGLLLMKRSKMEENGIKFEPSVSVEPLVESLPFKLTNAQQKSLLEIVSDMERDKTMNRLLQGDVGSGKTVVAAAAMYKAVKCGYQTVIMSPTETLARQHYSELSKILEPHGINVAFLSGSVKGVQRASVLEDIRRCEIQVISGTHALIQQEISFGNLGLVVTDEQHRFGVNQRISLTKKGNSPDTLVMTATPIPRTLAFILYGDLDVSIIDEMPPGRRQVMTKSLTGRSKRRAYDLIRDEIKNGRQAYVVTPLIEESEESELNSAKKVHRDLSARFGEFKVALIHGQMKSAEKDAVMSAFYAREIDVLVSTVLIEVGINVPNATVMLVENAERFGLAQLHQLRGRVGRGDHQSYCLLVHEGQTKESKERIDVMCSTNDGFVIAEKDLALRGPGEFFGTKQHGIPKLKLADLAKHVKVLKAVRDEAFRIIEDDAQLVKLQNRSLKERIELFFNEAEEIGL